MPIVNGNSNTKGRGAKLLLPPAALFLVARVLVKHNGVLFVCQSDNQGWRCGKCGRLTLDYHPKEGDICEICNSEVAEVFRLPDAERIRAYERQQANMDRMAHGLEPF